MPCQLFAQKCSNCQEITKISKCLGSPPNTLPLVIYIGIFCYRVLLHYNMSCKTIAVGLMVLSDGMVHFLKNEKNLTNLPKLSCGFKVRYRLSTYMYTLLTVLKYTCIPVCKNHYSWCNVLETWNKTKCSTSSHEHMIWYWNNCYALLIGSCLWNKATLHVGLFQTKVQRLWCPLKEV